MYLNYLSVLLERAKVYDTPVDTTVFSSFGLLSLLDSMSFFSPDMSFPLSAPGGNALESVAGINFPGSTPEGESISL